MYLIESYFKVKPRKTTCAQEFRAGVVTFLSLSYIIIVNSIILTPPEKDISPLIFATCLSASISCLFCGVFANLPLALAPGMGINSLVASEFLTGVMERDKALTCCFIASLLFALMGISGICRRIQNFIPSSLKSAIAASIGLFQAAVAYKSINLVVGTRSGAEIGDIFNLKIWASFVGLVCISLLMRRGVQGAVLYGIACTSLLARLINESSQHVNVFNDIRVSKFEIENGFGFVSCIFAILFVAVLDTAGSQDAMLSKAGLCSKNNLLQKDVVSEREVDWSFTACGIGGLLAATLGSSPVIVCNESTVGIYEGGRTGLTSLVIGSLFFLSLLFTPLIALVPSFAPTPVLLLIGALMMSSCGEIDWRDLRLALPAFICISLVPLSFSMSAGILASLLFFAITEFLHSSVDVIISSIKKFPASILQ